MVTIDLRAFYPCYTQKKFQNEENLKSVLLEQIGEFQDGIVEVSDEVAAELLADKRYSQTHSRKMRRCPSLSLEKDDGTLTRVSQQYYDYSPEEVLGIVGQYEGLCRALNSLPEKQGRRIDARFLLGRSVREIAESEGVSERNVRKSIQRGLEAMKKYLTNFHQLGTETG